MRYWVTHTLGEDTAEEFHRSEDALREHINELISDLNEGAIDGFTVDSYRDDR